MQTIELDDREGVKAVLEHRLNENTLDSTNVKANYDTPFFN